MMVLTKDVMYLLSKPWVSTKTSIASATGCSIPSIMILQVTNHIYFTVFRLENPIIPCGFAQTLCLTQAPCNASNRLRQPQNLCSFLRAHSMSNIIGSTLYLMQASSNVANFSLPATNALLALASTLKSLPILCC